MTNKDTNLKYWNKIVEDPPESFNNLLESENQYVQRIIREGSKILEIGCGTGKNLANLLNKKGEIYGVDNNPLAVIGARKKLFKQPLVSINFGDGRNLDYKDSCFDYVLLLGTTVGNFGDEKNKFYSEMKRVLKEDGEIILSTYNEDAFDERIKIYKEIGVPIEKIKGTTVFLDYPSAKISEQFSQEQLEEIFEENGLTPIDITKDGIGYFCRLKKVKGGKN